MQDRGRVAQRCIHCPHEIRPPFGLLSRGAKYSSSLGENEYTFKSEKCRIIKVNSYHCDSRPLAQRRTERGASTRSSLQDSIVPETVQARIIIF